MSLKTLRENTEMGLEWNAVTAFLSSLAVFPVTQLRLNAQSPWISEEQRQEMLLATEESLLFIERGALELVPIASNIFLDQTRRGALLDGVQLFEIFKLTRLIEEGNRLGRDQKEKFPRLSSLLSKLVLVTPFKMALKASLNEDGFLLDSASPLLAELRVKLRNAKNNVVKILEEFINRSNVRDALQDNVWMLRDNRYVLPVRTDRKGDVPGVARGVSQSGSTIFVEPAVLQSAAQKLEDISLETELEEKRILKILSHQAHEHFEELSSGVEILSTYDELLSRARFASRLNAVMPDFHKSLKKPRFEFKDAKHPLFVIEDNFCVANDLSLSRDDDAIPNIWVLTGPNAGGKTVAMRTVGLNLLMAKAGLFVCAREASLFSFEEVFIEIGDKQSREDDLSTFSGHLTHVKDMLDNTNEYTLLLLDEGFVGTDPAIGVSLARSTLEYIANKNASAIITTHFSSLKMLANENSQFQNASMEFEPHKLKPTYTLLNGYPGQSYALELGVRLSFPKEILNAAAGYYGEEAGKVERLLSELQEKRLQMQKDMKEQTDLKLKLIAELEKAKQETSSLNFQRQNVLEGFKSKLQKRLNAFENRLEVRERQFSKTLEKNILETTSSDSSEADTDSTSVSSPKGQSIQARTLKGKKLQGFAALEGVRIDPSKYQNKASETHEDELSTRAQKFRPPERMSIRDLLDEANESLDLLESDIPKINKKMEEALSIKADKEKPTISLTQFTAQDFRKGMRAKSSQFKEVGEVLRAADNKGFIEVQFGLLKTKVLFSTLTPLNEPQDRKFFHGTKLNSKPQTNSKNQIDANIEATFQHSGNTCDLRGMHADVSVEKLDRFLDEAMRKNIDRVIIIHGYGTERVKSAVRDFLQTSSTPLSYRGGTHGEGGDGVTIVKLL